MRGFVDESKVYKMNSNVEMRFYFIGISNSEWLDFSICFVDLRWWYCLRKCLERVCVRIFVFVFFLFMYARCVHCACFNSTYISECVAVYWIWLAFNGICSSVYCFLTKFKDQQNRLNPSRCVLCTPTNVSIGRSFLWGGE